MKLLKKDCKWYFDIIKYPLLILVVYLVMFLFSLNYLLSEERGNLDIPLSKHSMLILYGWIPLLLLGSATVFVGYRAVGKRGDYMHAAVSGAIIGLILLIAVRIGHTLYSTPLRAGEALGIPSIILLTVVAACAFCSLIGAFVAKNVKKKFSK